MSLSKPVWSYASSPQETPLLYQTIPERIAYFAKLHPKKEAFVDIDENGTRIAATSFGELDEKSKCFAKGLLEQGIEKGDVVAIGLPNSVEWLICTFGTLLVGGIPMYVNFVSRDGTDVLDTIKQSKKCRLLITEAGKDEQILRICEKLFGKISSNGSIECATTPLLKTIVFRSKIESLKKSLVIQDIIDAGIMSHRSDFPTIYPEDIASYDLTSGTTGVPKIVPKSHVFFLQLGYHWQRTFDLSPNDIYFNFQEMGWAGAYPYCLIKDGITRVSCALDIVNRSKDLASLVIKIIQKERCTFTMLHPKLIISILNGKYPIYDGWRLRTIWTAGVPIPSCCANIVPKYAELFVNGYGSTEVGLIASKTVRNPLDFKDFNVGRPVESTEIKVVDNDGTVVPVGVMGEILVRRNVTFSGYLNSPRDADDKKTKFGWYKTDDLGYMTNNCELVVTGRKSEAIKVSNDAMDELICPCVLEEDIRNVEGVEDVCVVSYNDESKFIKICACIERSPGSRLSEKDVENALTNNLIGNVFSVLIPTAYVFFDKLPRNSNGKILRSNVAKEAQLRSNEKQI